MERYDKLAFCGSAANTRANMLESAGPRRDQAAGGRGSLK
jgi:hypothetical protein